MLRWCGLALPFDEVRGLRMQIKKYIGLGAFCFFFDRVTKLWALKACVAPVMVTPWFSCSLAFNRGVAWSLFHSESAFVFAAVTCAVGAVMGMVLLHAYERASAGKAIWAETLVLAGAAGNIWDRCLYGGVVDFIALSYRDMHWPLFNVADGVVVVGVMLLFFEAVRS